MTGARLSWILKKMFDGICEACVRPFFSGDSVGGGVSDERVEGLSPVNDTHTAWGVGECKYGLYKALDVQVRGRRGW